jgi:hypothetical protein
LLLVAHAGSSHGMRVRGVDCRTTLCTATLEWPSFVDARNGFRSILHSQDRANCGREILLLDSEDPSAPYQATAVLDCTEWRAGNVD